MTIAHVSLSAHDPLATASLLAQLMDGTVFPFPPCEGAWMAVANDDSGTMFEVYPEHTVMQPGRGAPEPQQAPTVASPPWAAQFVARADRPALSPTHVALASPLSEERIHALGRAAGWRTLTCDREGLFRVVELWLDDRMLLEVLTPEETARYRSVLRPDALRAMFEQRAQQAGAAPVAEPEPAAEPVPAERLAQASGGTPIGDALAA